MEMICKAMHTENNDFYCVVKNDNEIIYALTDDELEDSEFTFPRIRDDFFDEDVIGTYKHFKGNNYEVIGEAFDSNSNKYIFYKALYDTDIKYFIRPYDMFFSLVDKEKYPDCEQEYRFMKMD